MASSKSKIQPVWGYRRQSSDLLDTAETLVDNLDSLADILDEIDEKYHKNTTEAEAVTEVTDRSHDSPPKNSDPIRDEPRLFKKLKDGLESARTLINCLKREKWRLNKREVSVELRMGEMEDYKTHIKQDLTSLNEMVDVLSVRVVALETALCEEQDVQERLEADKLELEERIKIAEDLCSELQVYKDVNQEEMRNLRRQRTDSSLQRENTELRNEIELIIEENCRLKEMVRQQQDPEVTSAGDCGTNIPIITYLDDKSNNNKLCNLEKY